MSSRRNGTECLRSTLGRGSQSNVAMTDLKEVTSVSKVNRYQEDNIMDIIMDMIIDMIIDMITC